MIQTPSDVTTWRRAAAALLCLACTPAGAGVLYKSIGPNGVVEFSDMPSDKSRSVERLQTLDRGSSGSVPLVEQGPLNEEKLRTLDPAVQRASAQVDLAERAFAVARRPMWTAPDLSRLTAPRMTRADVERVEFYKKYVIVARQTLLEVLQQMRRATVREELTASYEAPVSRP